MPIKELHESSAAVLAREMRENDRGDVGVLDPLVYKADASVMDCDDCVVAFRRYVFDQGVGVVI